MKMKKRLLAPILLGLCMTYSHAATLLTQGLAPDRNDHTGTIGITFTVASATPAFTGLSVTSLGFQDAGGDGLASAHTVGIWDSTGTLVASATITSGTTAEFDTNYRYVDLSTPVLLLAGQTYTIGATVFNGGDAWTDAHGQTNFTLSSDVTGVNADVYNTNTNVTPIANFVRPTLNGNGDDRRWAPGNMRFTIVPEPSAALLGGLGVLALFRRRRA